MPAVDWLPLLHELADEADAISTRYFQSTDLHVETKPDRSLVTKADLEVESAVRDLLRARHPDLGVFGEEHGQEKGSSSSRLIVDPIDATANFARGIPVYATLLAIETDGEVVAGLVSAPKLGSRWHASRGGGAFCGDQRLRVSGVASLADAQAFHGSLAGGEAVPNTAKVPELVGRTARQRGFGDFWQHMLVAQGSGEVGLDPVVAPWDVAPIGIIVEEAGGKATTVGGDSDIYGGSLVTTNGLLHDEVLAAFA